MNFNEILRVRRDPINRLPRGGASLTSYHTSIHSLISITGVQNAGC